MIRSAAVLAVCALAITAPAASAAWSRPVQVSGTATEYPWSRPDLAVAPDGSAAVAWQRSRVGRRFVEIARRPAPAARFGDPVIADFGSETFAGPVVAAASGGRALLLWARQGIASGEPRALGYGLTGLGSSPAVFPATRRILALHAGVGAGRRRLLWRADGAPLVGVRGSDGPWDPATELAPTASGSAFAEAADGRSVTAWVSEGRLRALAGDDAPVDLGPGEGTPGTAVARGGRGLVAWCAGGGLWTADWDGTAWSDPRRIGTGGTAGDCALAPAVALASDGTAVAAWRARAGGRLEVRAARRLAGGTWLSQRLLGRGPRNVGAPVAVLGPGGAALVAWSHPLGTFGSLVASRVAVAGAWSPRSDVGVRGFRAAQPDVGVDAAGRVTLAFLAVPNGPYSRGLRVMVSRWGGALP